MIATKIFPFPTSWPKLSSVKATRRWEITCDSLQYVRATYTRKISFYQKRLREPCLLCYDKLLDRLTLCVSVCLSITSKIHSKSVALLSKITMALQPSVRVDWAGGRNQLMRKYRLFYLLVSARVHSSNFPGLIPNSTYL